MNKVLFQSNVGRVDSFVRVVGGVLLVGWVLMSRSEWGWLGLYPLLTGVFGTDPLYAVLGVDTRRKRAG